MKTFEVLTLTKGRKRVVAVRVSGGDAPQEDRGKSYWFYDEKEEVVAVYPKSHVVEVKRTGNE